MDDIFEAMTDVLPSGVDASPGTMIHMLLTTVAHAIASQHQEGTAQVVRPHPDDVWIFRLNEAIPSRVLETMQTHMHKLGQDLGIKHVLVLPHYFAPTITVKHTGERFDKSDEDYDPACG